MPIVIFFFFFWLLQATGGDEEVITGVRVVGEGLRRLKATRRAGKKQDPPWDPFCEMQGSDTFTRLS